jgi:hypothetical protein
MSQPSTVTVLQGQRRANELGAALITSSDALSSAVLLSTPAGAKWYLPVYRSAAQSAGGSTAFAPSVTDDGTLTMFLESAPAPEIAIAAGGANPYVTGTTFALVVNPSGGGTRLFLDQKHEGGSIYRLSVMLAGSHAKEVRAALFDINPNVSIEVTQTVQLAAQQTPGFVQTNWKNPTIRSGLLDLFGGIPVEEASTYSQVAAQGNPNFPSEYLVLGCVYKAQVPAPPLPGYVQWQVNWRDRAYNYYQDNQDRSRVFYLPDGFEFAKAPKDAPTISLLQFKFPEGTPSVDKTRANFRVYGRPVDNPERISNAAQSLKGRIGVLPQMVSLQDAHKVKATFTQYLPNAEATGSNPAVQPNASIDLAKGLRNALDLNFAHFRALWAAIFSAAPENPLFRGWVDVELSDGRYKDKIDFDARLPKEKETSFFDDILDKTPSNTYPAKFTVRAVKGVFSGASAVLEISLKFTDGKTVTLDSEQNNQTSVEVERSIRDIVLGNQSPDEYRYRLRVVHQDGSEKCCECKVSSDASTIWIGPSQIANCTGPCS